MINALVAIGFLLCTAIAVWTVIIVMHRVMNPRPKKPTSPPKAIYNQANNEPIGFDFNHKDWDAPQWEAPEWTFDRQYMHSFDTPPAVSPPMLLQFDHVLSVNELRSLNERFYRSEANAAGMMVLPDAAVSVQYVNTKARANEYLSHIRATQSECNCKLCMEKVSYDNYPNEYRDEEEIILRTTSGEPVRMYTAHGYSQEVRHSTFKYPKPPDPIPVIKLTPPQLIWVQH